MTREAQSAGEARSRVFHFINVIRFVSAVWVVLSHFGAPPFDSLCEPFGLGRHAELVRKALIAPFSGVAAVMVFFVVSGFCIHFPYLGGRAFKATSFLAQRLTRIGLPLVAAIVLHRLSGTVPWFKNVVWSIYCEIIYYLGYPLLRPLIATFGAGRLVAATFAVSWLFCLLPDEGYGHIIAYGHAWTWLVCLPAWLCGCLLAEWVADAGSVPLGVRKLMNALASRRSLLVARIGIWGLSSILLVLGMEMIVPFKYSLPAFAFVVLIWMLAELKQPSGESWLSLAGLAGYSIYLCHPVAMAIKPETLPSLHPLLLWTVKVAITAVVCTAFYFIVEKPSHKLARHLGTKTFGSKSPKA